jgi:hypothetical protein
MSRETVRSSWRRLPPEHRRWIIANAIIGTAAVNLVGGGAMAWFATRGHPHVPLWSLRLSGRPSAITDTVGTFFFLPVFTCLFCSFGVHRSQRSGDLPALTAPLALPAGLERLPALLLRRGLILGAFTVALLGPTAVIALSVLDPGGLGRAAFVGYKAILGVGLGAVVTPLIAVRAMADPRPMGAGAPGDRLAGEAA